MSYNVLIIMIDLTKHLISGILLPKYMHTNIPLTQWLLIHIPTIPLGLLVLAISIAFALLSVLFTAGAIPEAKLGKYRGVTTVIFGGITFLYSIILVTIVTTSWIGFYNANVNVQKEASCLVELYRGADAFPSETSQRLHALLEEYGRDVVNLEWPSLQMSELNDSVTKTARKIWSIYTGFIPKNPTEQLFLQKSIDKITELRECRTKRLSDSQTGVYSILWLVLIVGEIVTISSISLFSEIIAARILVAVFFAIAIGLIFFTILLFDFPFTGGLTVSSSPIKLAMQYW